MRADDVEIPHPESLSAPDAVQSFFEGLKEGDCGSLRVRFGVREGTEDCEQELARARLAIAELLATCGFEALPAQRGTDA